MEGYSQDVAGRSFHHGRFVQRLRTHAASCPSVTAREAFVKRLLNGKCGCCQVIGTASGFEGDVLQTAHTCDSRQALLQQCWSTYFSA